MFTRNALILVFVLLSESVFGQQAVKFVHYNVENYLEMNRHQGGRPSSDPSLRAKRIRWFGSLRRFIRIYLV